MRAAYLAQTVRSAEEPLLAALPGVLMQRAATGLSSALLRELAAVRGRVYGARVLVLAGAGNNGGDALYAGAQLLRRGVRVRAWRTTSAVHHDAWRAFFAAGGREVGAVDALSELGEADLVVDGVLGIGGRPGLPEPVALFAAACADAGVPVVAVDVPSGLAADACGANAPHFTAALTVTFGGLKFCHLIEPAASACGRLELVDIGLGLPEPDLRQWEPADVAAHWPFPDATSDKYSRGVVGLDTGSDSYPGAAVLSTLGAVHAGAGMVRFAGAQGAVQLIRAAAPNVVFGQGRVQSRVLGCGWGDRPDGATVVADALAEGLPLLLDADALRFLPGGDLGEQVLLTPHAGELARLLELDRSEVAANPVAAVRGAATRHGCTVLLKGGTQYVCGPDGAVTLAVPGPAWTAQAGSGDTLAGLAGTLLAAGLAPPEAALAAASAQAMTALLQPGPHPPDFIARAVPRVVASLRAKS
ncbi:bifunctional ADP-dependent NAD(P)H-hydrate dehydratase/NAD(P)H-hydrate epimerase [Micropruina sonneratiae]|uniref:bifunctional ADP-dependent NAD(P)H-hydrate dehydratase/NAD(P)H-hydrate epimerase n=1 Tax=Micropruina sonneratiae TaxID=2986940 RepID=UPI002226E1F2|nr:bifunctional ADP-dependent NAD(P)H-hydrate dehydratase/NAD(P)H-hydrate epimerase [Micropruina sp. KQZ13P-5]MCW3156936.1 bifunctional ADP-dependent NAD(P)H-hydrate dehydratase/NAD(P)H-hydrate epimerase [Micropruina sp. KQZ13P-5]